MRLFLVAALLAVPTGSIAASDGPRPNARPSTEQLSAECPRTSGYQAFDPAKPLKPQKLGELPPGNLYAAVYRLDENGCEAPIVVKYGIGRR